MEFEKPFKPFVRIGDWLQKDGQVADAFQLQNEINRLVLQAIYYITSKTSVGLWQFVVDFPFFALTDIARLRCLILLRNPSKYTVGKLYEIDDANLLNILNPTIGSSGTLLQDLDNIGVSDRNYALTAMGQIVAEFEKVDCQHFTNELINVCFMEQTREAYSKVGSEIVSHILERKPQIFPSIVRYMNRKIDNLDAYAVDILSKASLLKCSLPADEVGSILGKFLLRDVEHPANKIARMILSGLDWGAEEDLFLPLDVHSTCAQSVVSAHFSLCKTRNSSIGKSITKSAKLMLKLPDAEQDFDRFCWNMLIRLKITPKPLATEPKNDLTAFFVYLQEKCLSSPETFMESGQNFWIELVNGSCFYGAGVILLKLIEKFPTRIHLFTASEKFKNALDTLLQADSTPYIHQFFNVGDKFPGPILRLLSTGLSNQFDRQDNQIQLKQLLNGWMQLLSCKRPTLWTGDKSTLHLIGVVSRTAFINDPIECSGLVDLLLMSYKAILNAWKDAPKGVLSWFSSHVPPRLIETSHLHYSPWASLLMLKAETQAHTKFYESLNANFAKHPKRELEDAVRRTASKTQWNLGVPQLPYYRWLEMCTQDSIVNDQFVYPLALQQLVTVLFGRTKVNGKSYCFGDRYYECSTSKHLFDELTKSLSKVEKNTDVPRLGSFYRAVGIWLCIPALYAPNFNNFHDVPMDFLLQRIFTGDSHPWVELADVPKLKERVTAEAKVFALFCHLVHPPPVASSAATHPKNIIELFQHLDIKSIVTQNFPAIPVHQNLPSSGRLSFDEAQSTTMVNGRVNVLVEDLIKISKTFLESKDKVETLNEEYGKKFHNLYVHSQTTLSIQMKCGAFLSAHCKRPGVQNVTVNASRYDSDVAMAMNENRLKRENIITELLQGLDNTSIISARMEYACYTLQSYTKNMEQYQPPPLYSSKVAEMPVDSRVERVQNTGRCLFYQLCEHSNRPEVLLFPALTNAVETCLLHLGVTFIAERSGEQMNLLRIVLAGHPLDVTRFFTPHCVSSDELLKLYMELSSGIRNASTKEASMALLKRLDIQYAGEKLPSNQFSSLLPVIFENLASVPNGTPLHELCGTHFEHAMFHGFPHNFVNGFRLLLSGCDSHCVPVSLFQTIIQRFSMDEFITTSNKAISGTKCTITIELAFQSIQVIAEQLQKSRHELATRLYSVWNFDYLDPVLQCADFFVRSVVCQQFISTDLPSAIENDLNRSFLLVLTIFGPLLEPVGHSNLAPFNPADNELAQNVVVSRFVDLLTWLPHSTYLPPGSETIEKLFFDYFAKTLSNLQRAGSSHIYTVYENKCVSFNWARLWPNLLDLSSLEKLLTEGSPDVAPFVVDIVVRIQWREVVQNMNGQPTDAHRAFYSILINVFARTVCRSTNYAKSRASVEKLLRDFLTLGHWHFVKSSAIEKVAQYIAASFPTDFLTNTNDILVAFSNLWRESCCFTTTRSMYVAADSPEMEIRTIALKQSMYLHAYVHLLLRSTLTKEDQCRLYKELLDKCYLLIGAACSGKTEKQTEDELQQFAPIAKELIAFWPQIPKEKHVDNFFQTITQWLTDHPESVLLLLVMHVAMSVLGKPAPQLGLKLLDKCVMIYFKRKLSCNWQEVCKWLTIPTNMREWLYTTPSVDAGIEPRFLTLNAHLLNEMSTLSSAPEEERVMRRLADYLQSIKPKYIQSEVSFLVVLEKWQRMVIRQYSNGVPIGIANEQLEVYISYLRKMFSDDKGVSFFNVKAMFSRKPLFPLRLQVVAQISSLYLTQQQTSLSQPPRQTGNQPVLCSRISAFREMQQEKKYQEIENISTVFQFALPYFTQPESHTLSNASTLLYRISDFLYTDSNKLLRHLDHSV
ncbi:hypothetical protein M3Y94_01122800 [Aphelenchoides besseyi]|nr:hypothetical protein M3Y94_01122800 [Aphelenchoides besseyi]